MATKSNKKPAKNASSPNTNAIGRVRKINRKNKKKIIKQSGKLPNSFVLLAHAMLHLWRYKKLFGGIFVLYVLLYVVLVKGLATNFQVESTRELIEEALGEKLQGAMAATALFGALIGTAGATASEAGSVYQLVLFIVFSLAIIWALRASYGGRSIIKVRESFYSGMYPLVPYLLVVMVVFVQLLPALLGLTIYNIVAANAIAVNIFQQVLMILFLVMSLFLSVYLISSSIFASYIVTLDKMTPLKALRSSKKLVKYRRWTLLRKILFLPVVIALFFGMVFLPLVLILPLVAEVLFLLCSLALIFVVHAYLYELYRELL
ncbi:MAG: hypothetical protein M3Q36_00410 [bacterium]|nr:hypothetical protein [bacterium]